MFGKSSLVQVAAGYVLASKKDGTERLKFSSRLLRSASLRPIGVSLGPTGGAGVLRVGSSSFYVLPSVGSSTAIC